MIRAALVGVSGYGRWHLLMAMEQALVGRLRLVGATIINQEEEAVICARLRRQGVPVFSGFNEMLAALAGQIDLVLLPTGIQWHAPMTIAALRAGAHVLVEKPVAPTLQQVDQIIAAQHTAGRLVAVGFQDLYVPAAHDIKRRILRGEIGGLRRITVCAQWPRPEGYFTRNSWAGRLRADGEWVLDSPVNNAFAHFVLLALFWAGLEPAQAAEVTDLEAELYRVHAIESFDTVCLRALTSSGVSILFYGSHAGRDERRPEICVSGDAGEIRWVYEEDYTIAPVRGVAEKHPVPSQLDTRLCVLESLVARLRGEPAFIVPPALARTHTRFMNALHEFFPIHTIDRKHLEISHETDGVYRRIREVDAALATGRNAGKLFGETTAPWAKPATARSLTGYELFAGVYGDEAAGSAVTASRKASDERPAPVTI